MVHIRALFIISPRATKITGPGLAERDWERSREIDDGNTITLQALELLLWSLPRSLPLLFCSFDLLLCACIALGAFTNSCARVVFRVLVFVSACYRTHVSGSNYTPSPTIYSVTNINMLTMQFIAPLSIKHLIWHDYFFCFWNNAYSLRSKL